MVLLGAALPKPHEALLREVQVKQGVPFASLHCLIKADTINPPEMGEWVADCFGDGATKLWHGSGHVIPGDRGERDAETVAAVTEFLSVRRP